MGLCDPAFQNRHKVAYRLITCFCSTERKVAFIKKCDLKVLVFCLRVTVTYVILKYLSMLLGDL